MDEAQVREQRQEEIRAVKRRLRRRVRVSTALLSALVITFVVHVSALRGGYVYDDVEAILENPDLATFASAGRLFLVHYWGEHANIGLYRPVVQLTYLLDGALFGFDPHISHALQLAFHLIAVWLAFRFLLRLGLHRTAAGVAALLLGIHPALLDASVWISGRTDVLCTAFMMLGLHAALAANDQNEGPFGRQTLLLGAAFLAGLFSKELAITLPILVLLLPGEGHWKRGLVLLIAFGIYAAFRSQAIPGFLPEFASDRGEGVLFRDRDLLARVALGARAVTRLLLFLPAPVGLAADHTAHPWASADAAVDGIAIVSLVGLVAILIAGVLLRRRDPIPGFLLAAIPVSLLPVLQIVPIGAAMAERFLYLPALFVFALVADQAWRRLWPALGFAVATLAILACALGTYLRIPIYRDRGSFSRDTLRVYPADHRAWNNLGVYHLIKLPGLEAGSPEPRLAEECFANALEIRPQYRRGLLNRARARLEMAEDTPDRHLLDPIEGWLDGLAADGDPEALYLLGKTALRAAQGEGAGELRKDHATLARQRYEAAAAAFLTRERPRRAAAAWKGAGVAGGLAGDPKAALADFERSLNLAPDQDGAAALRARLGR